MAPVISSHIPRAWVVYHSLLCICGVANVTFVETLPRGLRVTSLLYHVLTLTSIAPIFTMYCAGIDWHQDVFRVIERVSGGIPLAQILALAISSLVSSRFGKGIWKFMRYTDDYKKNAQMNSQTTWIYLRRQRLCNAIALTVVCVHVCSGCALVRVFDPVLLGQKHSPTYAIKRLCWKSCRPFNFVRVLFRMWCLY